MTPSSVEKPSFARLIRKVGPVAGVSPTAGRGSATSTSKLRLRSTPMLSNIDQCEDCCFMPGAPRAVYAPCRECCDASWISVRGWPAFKSRSFSSANSPYEQLSRRPPAPEHALCS